MFNTHPEVVSYLLQTYVTNAVIAQTDATQTRITQLSTMLTILHAKGLKIKSLRCGEVYEQYVLKRIFIEGVHKSVRHSMTEYWSIHPELTLCYLAHRATSQRALQKGTNVLSEKESENTQNTESRRGR